MASALIHICVAKELNKKLKLDEKQLILGSIAPDLSKHLSMSRNVSHFLKPNLKNVPDIDYFIEKYKSEITHPFMVGYLIHLYTDLLWFHGFIDKLIDGDHITLLDGRKLAATKSEQSKLVYHNYTVLNIPLIDAYQLDLSLFYEPVDIPNLLLDEVPLEKLQVLVDKMGIIIKNSKPGNPEIFNLSMIKSFITTTVDVIYHSLKEKRIIK